MCAVRWMRRFRVAVPVGLAVLVALYGVLALVPHTHGGLGVPRHDAVCTASGSPVPLYHLHPAAPLLPVHPCLACLFGPGVAVALLGGGWVLALACLALGAARSAFMAGPAPVLEAASRGPPPVRS